MKKCLKESTSIPECSCMLYYDIVISIFISATCNSQDDFIILYLRLISIRWVYSLYYSNYLINIDTSTNGVPSKHSQALQANCCLSYWRSYWKFWLCYHHSRMQSSRTIYDEEPSIAFSGIQLSTSTLSPKTSRLSLPFHVLNAS